MTSIDGPIEVPEEDIPSDDYYERVKQIPRAYQPYNLLASSLVSDRRFLIVYAFGLLAVFCWAIGQAGLTHFQLFCYSLVLYIFMYRIFIFQCQIAFKKRVCKALADIELGKVHCAEELAVYGLSPAESKDVIDGIYDCLLSDYWTCRFIGSE